MATTPARTALAVDQRLLDEGRWRCIASFEGDWVSLNNGMTVRQVFADPTPRNGVQLWMSRDTLYLLEGDDRYHQAVRDLISEAEVTMKAKMVEVSPYAAVPPRRNKLVPAVKRPSDKLDDVCGGIAQLVARMSGYTNTDRPLHDPEFQALVAEYSRLRDRMRELRKAMDTADGQFEVAQQQMIQLMEGR